MEFKPEVIREFILQTASHETAWLEFFSKHEIQPYIVVYEDLVTAYETIVKEIIDCLGIPHSEDIVFGERHLKKQADMLTEEWVQRYLDMYADTERMRD